MVLLCVCVCVCVTHSFMIRYDGSTLTDAHMDAAMQLSDIQHMLAFVFDTIDLQSDRHAAGVWPFFGLTVLRSVNITELLKLPRLQRLCSLWTCSLVIDKRILEVGVTHTHTPHTHTHTHIQR